MTPARVVLGKQQTGRREAASLSGGLSFFKNSRFLRLWLLVFVFIALFLYGIGLMPRDIANAGDLVSNIFNGVREDSLPAEETPPAEFEGANSSPLAGDSRLLIPEIGVNAEIIMPESADIDVLNAALAKGAVHYPSSALPGEKGNALIFGHSTGLSVVHNKNYAIFNRLQELKPGGIVRIRFNGREYWYKVASTKIKKAHEAIIRLDGGNKLLTLSTCSVFGAKDDRFVVEAEFMKSYPLRSSISAAGSSS